MIRLAQRTRGQPGDGRLLFPYVAGALTVGALDTALRLARSESQTLAAVLLAQVPLRLPLDVPLPRQAQVAVPLQEAIERRASEFNVPFDSRIERGRTHRHALRMMLDHERCERIVLAAAARDEPGLHADDIAWLLDSADAEVIVLRPALAS